MRTPRHVYGHKLVMLGVPLVTIAVLAERLGAPVGSFSTILAAVLAAVATTVVDYFFKDNLAALTGNSPGSPAFYLLQGGVNAALSVLSMVAIVTLNGV